MLRDRVDLDVPRDVREVPLVAKIRHPLRHLELTTAHSKVPRTSTDGANHGARVQTVGKGWEGLRGDGGGRTAGATTGGWMDAARKAAAEGGADGGRQGGRGWRRWMAAAKGRMQRTHAPRKRAGRTRYRCTRPQLRKRRSCSRAAMVHATKVTQWWRGGRHPEAASWAGAARCSRGAALTCGPSWSAK